MSFLYRPICWLLTTLICVAALAAESAERPRIALVLSGGGARGASHIGILQVFEELRIPVDYVTGNSMGAIVGGYYAAGYSPDELAHEITSIDWVDIFRDLPSRRNLPFRRKQDDRDFQVQLRLGFKGGKFQFPKGLVQGQKLDLVLQRLALPVWDVENFDELSLPFRCTATDIETGDAVILSSGQLPTAIRASMSVPGAFAPVEIDGRLLVDGMVSNNIPIDAAKAFSPDVVIAIDIGTPPLKLDQIQSAFGISGQVLSLLMEVGTKKQLALLEESDMLIKPDLTGISTSDFPRVGEAIERGRVAAEAYAESLRRFSVGEAEWQRYLERQRKKPRPLPVIQEVSIDNESKLSDALIRSRVNIEKGQPLDISALEDNIQSLFAMDVFESVDWELQPLDSGTRLLLHTRQKSWGTNNVRFKLQFEENFSDTHIYNIGFRVTAMPVNTYNGEWRNDFQVGDHLRVGSEFYQPFTASSKWFVAPSVRYETPEVNVFREGVRAARYTLRNTTAQLDIGRELGLWGEFRVGFGYWNQRASPITGDSSLPILSFDTGAYYARFAVDTVDSVNFPTRGVQGAIRFAGFSESLGADSNSQQLSIGGSVSHTFRRTTVTYSGRFVSDFGDRVLSSSSELGGFLRLSGLSRGEVAGPKTLLNNLVLYQQLAAPSLLGFKMPVYLGVSFESGGAWNEWEEVDFSSMVFAGSVFIGADTVLGPLHLAYGYAERGNSAVYFSLSKNF